MNFRWLGPLALLAILFVGDQIRINRPGHKYRLTLEVETPQGIKSAAGVMSVHPDRGYSRSGHTITKGDALLADLGGGKNLVALMVHLDDGKLDFDGMNYLALRAYGAARGQRLSFSEMNRVTGPPVAVTGALIPVLVSFGDIGDAGTARLVAPDGVETVLGPGYRLHGMSVETVPNGLWPLDFGGFLGEPVTRGIEAKLPWLNSPGRAAAALEAASLPRAEPVNPVEAFTRK
jgi:hypothetical protein